MRLTSQAGPPNVRPEDAPALTFYQGLERRFQEARGDGEVCDRAVALGGVTVRISFSTQEIETLVMRCLAHIEVDVPEQSDAAISCLSGDAIEIPWNTGSVPAEGEVRSLVGGNVWITHDPRSGRIEAVEPGIGRAVSVFPDPAALAPHELASPLRASLLRLVDRPGLRFLHAGGVSTDGGAALLVGPSGAGKSTLALACLSIGLCFLGDDYVVVHEGSARPAVCAVHASAKVSAGSLDLLGHRFDDLLIPAVPGKKQAVALLGYRPSKLIRRASLAAIIVPRIDGEGTYVRPLSPLQALLAMAPSTMIQHPGRDPGALTEMRELVNFTPCWELGMDRDLKAGAAALGDLLG